MSHEGSGGLVPGIAGEAYGRVPDTIGTDIFGEGIVVGLSGDSPSSPVDAGSANQAYSKGHHLLTEAD